MNRIPYKAITSRDNPLVRRLAVLLRSATACKQEGFCLLEGEHLAQSYTERVGQLETLVIRDVADLSVSQQALAQQSMKVVCLAPSIFDSLSSLANPTGVMAVAAIPQPSPLVTCGFVLALDEVQDPGNVGALIRTAAAAGVTQVWLSSGCAGAWAVKTLRAAQGAHFHIAIVENVDLVQQLNVFSGECWATLPRSLGSMTTVGLFEAAFSDETALILSNEGRGLSADLLPVVTHGLSIPMAAGVESLNVAVAGAIALYAVARKRL